MSDLADPRASGPSPFPTAGAIIPFPAGGRAREPAAIPGGEAPGPGTPERGRILLFTGVRYERLPEAAQVVAPPAPEGVRRRPRPAAPTRRRQPS